MLILRHRDIRELMDFSEYVAAVEEGYQEVAAGRAINVPRGRFAVGPAGRVSSMAVTGENGGAFTVKAAISSRLGGALSMYTTGLPAGLRTYLALWDLETGELAALIDSLYYDWLKTGAVGALSAKHLAPAGAAIVALFGTGRHARMQLRALVWALHVERIQVYGRDPERRERFAQDSNGSMGIDVVPARSPREALAGARVITTITTAQTPVFDGRELDDGPLLINAMGAHHPAREVDEHVVRRSRVLADDRAQALREKGEVVIPIAEGRLTEDIVSGDLADVVADRIPRCDPQDPWTLFLSGGTGIEDVAVARRLVRRARERGVGLDVPFEIPVPEEWAF